MKKNYTKVQKQCGNGDSILLISKETNVVNLSNFSQNFKYYYPYRTHYKLDEYLKAYSSKIEFIGSMD